MKIPVPSFFILALIFSSLDAAEPVIRKEIREENGKKVEYMWIDGIKVHETDLKKQPAPPVVEPKPYDAETAKAPEGATVLFDGSKASVANWTSGNGEPTKWKLIDNALESVRGSGYLKSRAEFGSCRLHVEFATPAEVKGSGQGRGNSGVFLMGQYEIQVLDSYENVTYPDGQCGALYGRAKPLVNASRRPGEWQTYDITFHRPLFDAQGNVTRKAKFHVVHNGHVIHDNLELTGGTGWRGSHSISEYRKHGDKGPLQMQDHGNPVRYRNIWIQELDETKTTADADSAGTLLFDFTNESLNGWTVEMGESIFRGGLAAAIPQGEDGAHPTMLARSPMFRLEDSGDLAIKLKGGTGGKIPSSARGLAPDTINRGPMGAALRRVTDDAWVLVAKMPQNGGSSEVKFSQEQLGKLLEAAHDEVYTLDFFDAGHGGWGHAELVSASIPGKIIDPLPTAPDGFENARLLFLSAAHGKLAFDQNELFATPGSKLALTLFNSDEMAHNWVLCKAVPKVADELGMAVMTNIETMTERGFVPEDSRILKHSTLVAPGTSDTQYFTAPSETDDYPYVCTFPGHHVSMRGILKVREKLPLPKPGQIKQIAPPDEFSIAVKTKPVLQRGPLKNGGPSVVCIGTPEGIHFAFDTSLCTISRIWTTSDGEPFLNTKAAWGGRGGSALNPIGQQQFSTKEPTSLGNSRFRSYDLPKDGLPIFEFGVDSATYRLTLEPREKALLAHFESESTQQLTWKLESTQSIGGQSVPGTEVEVSGKFSVRYELAK